jgi:hypothetical protein
MIANSASEARDVRWFGGFRRRVPRTEGCSRSYPLVSVDNSGRIGQRGSKCDEGVRSPDGSVERHHCGLLVPGCRGREGDRNRPAHQGVGAGTQEVTSTEGPTPSREHHGRVAGQCAISGTPSPCLSLRLTVIAIGVGVVAVTTHQTVYGPPWGRLSAAFTGHVYQTQEHSKVKVSGGLTRTLTSFSYSNRPHSGW